MSIYVSLLHEEEFRFDVTQSVTEAQLNLRAWGSTDRQQIFTAIDAVTPTIFLNVLQRTEITIRSEAADVWLATVKYRFAPQQIDPQTSNQKPPGAPGNPKTGGASGTEVIARFVDIRVIPVEYTRTHSLQTVQQFDIPQGAGVLQFDRAINVAGGQTNGISATEYITEWVETYRLPDWSVTQGYIDTVCDLVGSVNANTWRGFAPRSILLAGFESPAADTSGLRMIRFTFQRRRDEGTLTVNDFLGNGDFRVVTKAPWDYVWVYFIPQADANGNVRMVARQLNVERVYVAKSFTPLGIG